MDNYKQYKIFRKRDIETNNINLFIFEYEQNINYSKFIKTKKENGYRQLILHSKLLVKLIEYFLDEDNLLIRNIILNEEINKELNIEVKNLLKNYKSNPDIKYELYKELFWAFDQDSIDIEKIELTLKENETLSTVKVLSNGILSGTNIKVFFDKYLRKILYGDLNEL